MKRIPADFDRYVEIEGKAVPRPVDIDRAQTGFTALRSLRIYQFAEGSVIDGHAEEDEVLIVVLGGSIELTLSENEPAGGGFLLQAPGEAAPGTLCAAYLPPLGAYRLVARTTAEVAYARATPADGPSPRVFEAAEGPVVLDVGTYPRQLRARLFKGSAEAEARDVTPLEGEFAEALMHVKGSAEMIAPAPSAPHPGVLAEPLNARDTLAFDPGEQPVLRIARGALVLVVFVPFRP